MKKHLLMLAIASSCLVATQASALTQDEYKAAKERIEASYKADKSKCDPMKDNAKDVCEKQAKGKVKEQWGKLTDDDFDVIAGKRDQLLGRIQERHGISRDEAERQVSEWESRDGRTPSALWYEKY
jgi:uncharacterized protein YjbJ (UPF0337 family)